MVIDLFFFSSPWVFQVADSLLREGRFRFDIKTPQQLTACSLEEPEESLSPFQAQVVHIRAAVSWIGSWAELRWNRPPQVFSALLTWADKLQQILYNWGILFANTAWSLQGIWAGLSFQALGSDLPNVSGCHIQNDSCSCAVTSWQQLLAWAEKG